MADKKLNKTFASQLQSAPTYFSGATYSTVRVPPINNGSATQTVAPGSSLEVNFLITPKVINLAQTTLYYQLLVANQIDNAYSVLHNTSFGEIQSISLAPESGRVIADVPEARNYLRMIGLITKPMDDFMTSVPDDGLNPSGTLVANNITAAPAQYVALGATGGTAVPASVNYNEVKHLTFSSTRGVAAAVTTISKTRKIKLGLFKGTLFALDKDIYFPQNMVLKVVFSLQKVGWACVEATANAAASAAALQAQPFLLASELTVGMTMSNMNLLLQTETRPDIIEQVQAYYKQSGVRIPIEFLKLFKTSQSGSQHNPQMNISSADGQAIRRIITSPFAQLETKNYALDNSNITDSAGVGAQGKLISYRTVVDGDPVQRNDVSCIQPNLAGANVVQYPNDDWELNRKFFKKSAVQDQAGYYKSWFHMDDFLGQPDLNAIDAYSVGGLKTDKPHKYEIVAQVAKDSAAAFLTLNWYMYAIMSRELVFGDTSVDVV